jgi:8-oxo-dGTP pyrophosphatase MutT (NUDIX family)
LHRQPLRDLLERYRERHVEERDCVTRVLDLVAAHANCFERTCLPGHITASAWIVSADHEQFLLTHHRKLGRWLQLGGHADGETDALAVALREAREESGMERFEALSPDPECPILDVDVHRIPAFGTEPAHDHHDVRFLLVAGAGQPLRISDESHDLRWFEHASFEQVLLEESLLRMGHKARRLLEPCR